MSNVKLEFFEPPAVPGFGAAGGISLRVLDKTISADYQRLGEVTDKFMAALKKRKELTNLFTFYAANYPQYELIIDNDVAMQKGVSIKAAMDNLNILIGSTYEQGFIRFNQFYKVYVQARPEFRRYPEDLDNLFVKNDKGRDGPLLRVHDHGKEAGSERDHPLQPVHLRRHPRRAGRGLQHRPGHPGDQGGRRQDAAARLRHRLVGSRLRRGGKGNEAVYIFLIVVAFVYLVLVGDQESSSPYRICGGLQDNMNWVGPSRTFTKEGIRNSDWTALGGGDGFSCVFDPNDSNVIYSESQTGAVFRIDLASGFVKRLRPTPAEGQPFFRFHWNAPLMGSRHEKGVLYLGGNRVFRLSEHGEIWTPISGDLSTQDPARTNATGSGAEVFGVVYTLAESPLAKGRIWAGTDDGKVWVTSDEGAHWTDLSGNLPAEARGLWMGRIEASPHDANVAYLAVETHRSGKITTLAYRTADLGRTWQKISSDLPADGPVKVVREDPKNADLLFAGTELGLYASLDRGAHWSKFGELPTVAVDDIAIQPNARDLVVGTHGRSLYVVDDIAALEEATPEIRGGEAHLFPPRPARAVVTTEGFADWSGAAVYRGDNPKDGALLTFWIPEYTGDEVEIEIQNALEQPVAKWKVAGTPGFQRAVWDLKPSKELLTEYGGEGALFVRPGDYTVTLKHGKTKSKQPLKVEVAPGIETR